MNIEKATFHDFTSRSPKMREIFQIIQTVAKVDWNVHIEGETGVGKDLVARAIHYQSSRKKGPFIVVNCAGLSETLLISELFGHVKGAFTGACYDHKGYFEEAEGGTLFLDEIGDISPKLQATLLRVMEQKSICRIGEATHRIIDVRIITATHHNLQKHVEQAIFRSDLLYRIRVCRILLPPLRERKEDIPLLAYHFLQEMTKDIGKEIEQINPEAQKLLTAYHWPGNVRELKSTIQFAILQCKTDTLTPSDFPPETNMHFGTTPKELIESIGMQKESIINALRKSQGKKAEASRILGMSRSTFYRKLKEFDISL